MRKNARVFITNHKNFPGNAFVRILKESGFNNLLLKTQSELNLSDEKSVHLFFQKEKPDYVILTQGKAGGVKANIEHPAEFLYDNLQIQNNVLHSSWQSKVKKLLFIGASCVYPRDSSQPMKEEYLLTGPLEPTSEPYSIAKIAGIKMCQYYNAQYKTNFISLIPATMYGPGDDFDVEEAHVIPALISKLHRAKEENRPSIDIWGRGFARREFIYVDDMVDASLFLMKSYNDSAIINVGAGSDISIRELAQLIKDVVGFNGRLEFDATKPEGVGQKLLDVAKINSLGWKAKTDLKTGICNTCQQYTLAIENLPNRLPNRPGS